MTWLLILAVRKWTGRRWLEAATIESPHTPFPARLTYVAMGRIGPLWLPFSLGYACPIPLPL